MLDLRPGLLIAGRYRLDVALGTGGQATAWAATDTRDHRPTVLKAVRASDRGTDPRFEREAAVLRYLHHPHIVTARGFVEDRGHVFLRVDRVEGPSLREVLHQRGQRQAPWSPASLVGFVDQVCSALAYCHRLGVIHRDLKPANLMVSDDRLGHVTVLDFGVARLLDVDDNLATTAGRLLGTVRYASPEQIRGTAVEPSSDLFAFASILYEQLTLRRAWLRGDDELPLPIGAAESAAVNHRLAVAQRIVNGDWGSLATVRPELGFLDRFFATALHPEVHQRFPEADPFARAWRQAVALDPRVGPGAAPLPDEFDPTVAAPSPLRLRPSTSTPALEPPATPPPAAGPDEAFTVAVATVPRPPTRWYERRRTTVALVWAAGSFMLLSLLSWWLTGPEAEEAIPTEETVRAVPR
jgi:serine/threonine-protein kinase